MAKFKHKSRSPSQFKKSMANQSATGHATTLSPLQEFASPSGMSKLKESALKEPRSPPNICKNASAMFGFTKTSALLISQDKDPADVKTVGQKGLREV